IVTHAGLWALDQFHGSTDMGVNWEREMGDPYRDPARWWENSPDRDVAAIRTPMLVIHGMRDYRVAVNEALRLWTDLRRHGVPGRCLLFPDENHWILKPGNARVWYETVLAFRDDHGRCRAKSSGASRSDRSGISSSVGGRLPAGLGQIRGLHVPAPGPHGEPAQGREHRHRAGRRPPEVGGQLPGQASPKGRAVRRPHGTDDGPGRAPGHHLLPGRCLSRRRPDQSRVRP